MAEKELFGNSEQLNDLISRQAAKRMTERNVGLRNATNDKKAWSE